MRPQLEEKHSRAFWDGNDENIDKDGSHDSMYSGKIDWSATGTTKPTF
jgi:hypothetical protein